MKKQCMFCEFYPEKKCDYYSKPLEKGVSRVTPQTIHNFPCFSLDPELVINEAIKRIRQDKI